MSLLPLLLVALGLALAVAATGARRRELRELQRGLEERTEAKRKGSHRARLQFPHVDLSRCIGCGTCVAACPEEGVLEVIHGQALVVHGARCVGHGRCAAECPVGAIALTLGDLSERRDIPALTDRLEVPGRPGLFLAGEVTGYALVRTAIQHGATVAAEVARRAAAEPAPPGDDLVDLCIVGAGPAGLACALEARRLGLSLVLLDQEEVVGGTVAKYPRNKLVMTQPVELPLHGRLDRTSYRKEELIELWERIAREQELPFAGGHEFLGAAPDGSGAFAVTTSRGVHRARYVCLALGRRGTPRKLGVPGEDSPKVCYALQDARSWRNKRLLVVGGGDSAIEAALGLAEQPGNQVTLSYRKAAFFRLKARNEARIEQAAAEGRIEVVYSSTVSEIGPDEVVLLVGEGEAKEERRIGNDAVFVLAGGIPPFPLLETCGVSFDPADRPTAAPLVDQGPGLFGALLTGLFLTLAAIAWVAAFRGYYALEPAARAGHELHPLLRSSRGVGLGFGIAAAGLILLNLSYLVRRSPRLRFALGSLQAWMTGHVATGVLAFVLAMLHAGLDPGATVGGRALQCLGVLVATGAVGRYFYSFVPRAANGRELALDEVESQLTALSSAWDQTHREFGARIRQEIEELVRRQRWERSFLGRLWALVAGQRSLRRALAEMRRQGRRAGIPASQLRQLATLARRAHRTALVAAHFEDVRGLMASWRFLHRWIALLMVLVLLAHVVTALRFADLPGELFG
ncbi:MAG: FAD-dependent oxidoreductase [Planctomycetota bacterium]|nr:MAG: FAD-dependent oxidoreductase [Planctomycetota bacterium]